MTDNERASRNQRRDETREQARLLRESHRKRDRRNRLLLQGGIPLVAVAIVAIVILIIVQSGRPAGPGPQNMASDGIVIGQGAIAATTPAVPAGGEPVASARQDGVLDIRVYVDYLCTFCAGFDETNGAYISSLIENGYTTIEVHPIAVLDRASQGTRYSTRAANAAACMANYSPDQFWAWNTLMFQQQPDENSPGLSDDELIALTEQAGAQRATRVAGCIRDQQFKGWVGSATTRALNGPLPNTDVPKVTAPPTVLVNGVQYTGPIDDLPSFQAFVVQQAGNDFVQDSTTAPSATPTPTP